MAEPDKITSVTLPVDVVNRVLAYLVRQPFADVSELVYALKTTADESFAAQQRKEPSND